MESLMRFFKISAIVFLLPLLLGCAKRDTNQNSISIEGQRFIDAKGRQIIFNGISVVNKNPKVNYLGPETREDFANLAQWGFNIIRLGVIWDGLEPEPGVYDDEYLKGIDQRIEWARENGIYVFLDMHQDLYSVQFSDGAPEWATITDGKPHLTDSPVWSDAYFSSPAVQTAWDHFWANSPAPDGIGLQDHYANAWVHLAQRYAADTTVIAYDIMNEPFMGSEAVNIFPAMLSKGAEVMKQINPNAPSVEELAAKWMTAEGRFEILVLLSEIEIYKQVIDATQPIYNEFEKYKLMPMFNRVAAAIRGVDASTILFLETTMGSNMGVYTGIEPITNAHGKRDPLQAYAPHGYDLVTDTEFVAHPSDERIELIFSRHEKTTKRLDMPMIVGEWGAYGHSAGTFNAATDVVKKIEHVLCGNAYWDFSKKLAETDHFAALSRPYPQRISGELTSYYFNAKTNTFTCNWEEKKSPSEPTIIYIPERLVVDKKNILIEPSGGIRIIPINDGSKNMLLTISPTGESTSRHLSIQFKQ
jgi:endoglycosylceramidase